MHVLSRTLVILGLAVSGPAHAQVSPGDPVVAKANAGKPFVTTGCLRLAMDSISRDVRLLVAVKAGKKPPALVPVLAHSIVINVPDVGAGQCGLSEYAAINAFKTIGGTLRQGAVSLEKNPADLSVIPPMDAAVQSYRKLFYDDLRQDGPSPEK